MSNWNEIADIVRGSREVHEMMLKASEIHGTSGTCLYASFVLRMSLEKFGNCQAVIRGGDGQSDGGAVDSNGELQGHYWVEGITPEGLTFIADITADQFGHAPVYFEPSEYSRKRYIPGDDALVSMAVIELGKSIEAGFKTE